MKPSTTQQRRPAAKYPPRTRRVDGGRGACGGVAGHDRCRNRALPRAHRGGAAVAGPTVPIALHAFRRRRRPGVSTGIRASHQHLRRGAGPRHRGGPNRQRSTTECPDRAGAVESAVQIARLARYQSIQYQERVRRIVADSSIHPDTHDWVGDVPESSNSALAHVGDRLEAEAVLLDAVAERRSRMEGPDRLTAANQLIEILRECRHRHNELHGHLIGARSRLREEALDDRFARPSHAMHRASVISDLLNPFGAADARQRRGHRSTPGPCGRNRRAMVAVDVDAHRRVVRTAANARSWGGIRSP